MTVFREAWPSEHKLSELRNRGEVAFSSSATVLAASLASGAYLFSERLLILELLTKAVSKIDQAGSFYAQAYADLALAVLGIFLKLGLIFLLVFIVLGLLQTRFLLRPALLGIDPARLSPFRQRLSRRFSSLIPRAAWLLILMALMYMLIWRLSGLALGSLSRGSATEILREILPGLSSFLLGGAIFLGLLIVPWLALTQLRYLMKHRMSREEVEREARS